MTAIDSDDTRWGLPDEKPRRKRSNGAAAPSRPLTDYMDHLMAEGVLERLSEGWSLAWVELGILMRVERVTEAQSGIAGELTVERAPEGSLLTARIMLESLADRWRATQALRERDQSVDWQTLLDTLCRRVVTADRTGSADGLDVLAQSPRERLGIVRLADLPATAHQELLNGRFARDGHTIMFGPGGVGKGAYAALQVVQLTQQGETVLIVDYEAHPDEWRQRVISLGGREAAERAFYVSPSSAGWKGPRGAIWRHAPHLREVADEVKATYLFIDSIVPACGAVDALKPEAPGQYHTALALIGRPACSLAHVTKSEDLRYPFGSAFWHNLARVTWSLSKQPRSDGAHSIVLQLRKANNYAHQGKYIVTFEWWEGAPREVTEQPYSAKIAELAADVLATEAALTATQITDRLNAELDEGEPVFKKDSIRAALRRGLKAPNRQFTVTGDGESARWALAEAVA